MLIPKGHKLTDQEFYTYIEFFEVAFKKRFTKDHSAEYNIYNFGIGEEDLYKVYSRLFNFLQIRDFSVSVSTVHLKQEEIDKDLQKKHEKEREELQALLDKIKNGKSINFSDVGPLSWVWYNIYTAFSFLPHNYKISEKEMTAAQTAIDEYLDAFVNNKLATKDKNYYRFEMLVSCLINIIQKDRMIELYGNNFIIQRDITESGDIKSIPDFCLIQTVYALQKIGYLTVNRVWEERRYPDRDRSDNTIPTICANITVHDTFLQEINKEYKKENPKNTIESWDGKKGILKFAGEEIPLSPTGKETDAALLMNVLLNAENDDWIFNDEIYQKWSFNDADKQKMPKNKAYAAARNLNNLVAIKTKVTDLIEYTTQKARINPKYKVDK